MARKARASAEASALMKAFGSELYQFTLMCRASAAEVVTWLDAIAERSRSTPAPTFNSDDIAESSARRPPKANASSCARVSLAIMFMEIPSEGPIRC